MTPNYYTPYHKYKKRERMHVRTYLRNSWSFIQSNGKTIIETSENLITVSEHNERNYKFCKALNNLS